MSNLGWRARLYFLLAGAIFVLCQVIVSGTRSDSDRAALGQAGDRSFRGDVVPGLTVLTGRGSLETDGQAPAED
jgi:hypothetical protein